MEKQHSGSECIFRKGFPDAHKTPPLRILCLKRLEDVIKRFESEGGRINDADKII